MTQTNLSRVFLRPALAAVLVLAGLAGSQAQNLPTPPVRSTPTTPFPG